MCFRIEAVILLQAHVPIALVAIGWHTLEVLFALGALKIPAGADVILPALLATLAVVFCVVFAIAVLARATVAGVSMTMAFARPAPQSDVLACHKESFDTLLTLTANRVVLTETADSRLLWTMLDSLEGLEKLCRRGRRLVQVQLAGFHADVGVLVAVVEAGHTLLTLSRVANVKRLAVATLWAHGVVVTLLADIQKLWPRTVAVTIAVAQNGAVAADISKMAAALVRLHTDALIAAFPADWLACQAATDIARGRK